MVERILLFRPLVFFSAFGRPEGFACLKLAIDSFRQRGSYDGAVVILTDRDQDQLKAALGDSAGNCLAVPVATGDFLDYLVARFRVTELPHAKRYQPVLYSETDIVVNRPIGPLLARLLRTDHLCVSDEKSLLQTEWYGRDLFAEDASAKPRHELGFTTGLMAWRSHHLVEHLFKTILQCVYGRAKAVDHRDNWSCYDQPIANYVVNKVATVDRDVLKNLVLSLSHSSEPMEAYAEDGFVHFYGGLNAGYTSAGHKAERMASYLEFLAKRPIGGC